VQYSLIWDSMIHFIYIYLYLHKYKYKYKYKNKNRHEAALENAKKGIIEANHVMKANPLSIRYKNSAI